MMLTLNERIINELQRTEVKNLSHLINYMKGEKGFFWVRSGEHDHWTNGTAQHSWRVYQYIRYMWKHPEEIPYIRETSRDAYNKTVSVLAPDKIKALTENEIILTGLLHDVGKMWGCSHHASNSKKIIDKYLGSGFSERNPNIVGAIFFHHNMGKDGGFLNAYKESTLKELLNKADSMAAGTAWNSTRFLEHRSQRYGKLTSDVKHLRREAMDRTRQVLKYRMFLDCSYNLQTIVGISSKNIIWNTRSESIKGIKNGTLKGVQLLNKEDYITAAQRILQEKDRSVWLVVGIDISIVTCDKRSLRQETPYEEELLICSNVLMAFYMSKNIGNHRYAYSMRDEIKQYYLNQSLDNGIYLPQMTFFRDGESKGFQMVKPWKCDVLLVPGWNGAMVLDK